MKAKQWIVVAGASMARVLRSDPPTDSFVLLDSLRHPEGRPRGRPPVRDRPIAVEGSAGNVVFEHRIDAQRRAARAFARQVAEHLDDAWMHGEFDAVTLIAPAPFLADLRLELSGAVRQRVQGALDMDLVGMNARELQARLKDLLKDLPVDA